MFTLMNLGMCMMVNFPMVFDMEVELWSTPMEINMKGHGKMEFGMDQECILGQLRKIKSKTITMENG